MFTNTDERNLQKAAIIGNHVNIVALTTVFCPTQYKQLTLYMNPIYIFVLVPKQEKALIHHL